MATDKDPNYPAPMKGLVYEPYNRIDKKGKLVRASMVPPLVITMPKLNGVRMRWDVENECLRTNKGVKVGSCDHIVEQIMASDLRYMPLDGESYIHGNKYSFQQINGLTRRKTTTPETTVLEYHVFDQAMYGSEERKEDRLRQILALYSTFDDLPSLHIVPWKFEIPAAISKYYRRMLALGYEGIMICDPNAAYTPGKGEWMWKYKPVFDSEFKFTGFKYTDEGRNAGMFAALVLEMENGHTFTCAGISDDKKRELLENPPPIGAAITIEYGDLSVDGTPIFPRFKDVRWDQ